MNVQLRELLAEVSFGETVRHERLELIPLRLGRKSDLEYLLFDETLAATDVRLEASSRISSSSSIGTCPTSFTDCTAPSQPIAMPGTTSRPP